MDLTQTTPSTISISGVLKRLASVETALQISAEEVAAAVSLVFTNRLSPVQFAVLLWAMHTTGLDHQPAVLAACAASMRNAAVQLDAADLRRVIREKHRGEGGYRGGLCDVVGTGGDGHNTYNISTTSSILASALLLMAKHGNNSSTSLSGSADLLQHAPGSPIIAATTAHNLAAIYARTNYAFLYAREWHPGMRHGASVRKQIPVRTVFNLMGPLANPVHDTGLIEARILGVARKDIGLNFAEALRIGGARKALVVCGDENLDELSCAGPTHCWYLHERPVPNGSNISDDDSTPPVEITKFMLTPEDFGLPRHSLDEVHGGKGAAENAQILTRILHAELPLGDPVLDFVLLNTAALLTVSGICEADTSNMGSGDDGQVVTERGPGGLRWKEGLRRAIWCVQSKQALQQWEAFVAATHEMPAAEPTAAP